jgi:hypothetical protein
MFFMNLQTFNEFEDAGIMGGSFHVYFFMAQRPC